LAIPRAVNFAKMEDWFITPKHSLKT